MKFSWYPTVPILAVLAIPFGLAIYDDTVHPNRGEDDLTLHKPSFEAGYDYGSGLNDFDTADLDPNPYLAEDDYEQAAKATMGESFFQELFFTGAGRDKPALSGALEALKFGDPRIDDQSAKVVRWSDYGETEYEGASLYLGYNENRLADVTVSFLDDGTMMSRFETRWGEPDGSSDSSDGTKSRVWLDADNKIAAVVESEEYSGRVAYSRYMPLAELIAPDNRRGLGIGEHPLLGSGRAAVLAQYKDLFDPYGTDEYAAYLTLPRTEYSSASSTSVRLDFSDNRVVALEFSVDFNNKPEAAGQLVELFAKKLGKQPKVEDEYGDGDKVATFSGKPTIEIHQYESIVTVRMSSK